VAARRQRARVARGHARAIAGHCRGEFNAPRRLRRKWKRPGREDTGGRRKEEGGRRGGVGGGGITEGTAGNGECNDAQRMNMDDKRDRVSRERD